MCTPMAAVMAASSAVQFAGQQSATDAYNAQAAAAHRDAAIAAGNKYGDLQKKFFFDEKSLNQEGYKSALKARSEQGTLAASAGSSGIAGGSLTLDALVAQSQQQAAENESRIQTKRDDSTEAFRGQTKSVEAEAQQRINATPFKEGPNPLGLAIGMASAGVSGAAGVNGVDLGKMTWSQMGSIFGR